MAYEIRRTIYLGRVLRVDCPASVCVDTYSRQFGWIQHYWMQRNLETYYDR